MKKVIGAGLLVFGGLMTTAVAVANADEYQVEGNYATSAACQADGNVGANIPGATAWRCSQGADGLWYLYVTK